MINFVRNNKSIIVRILLLIFGGIALFLFLNEVVIEEEKFVEYNRNINSTAVFEEQHFLNDSGIFPSQFGLENGVKDTTIYIYAAGTKFNDDLIYESVLSAQKYGSTNEVNILLLFDRATDPVKPDFLETRLMHITKSESGNIESTFIESLGRANMGDPQTLYDFISYGQSNFPAKKNVLILDGVGRGVSGLIFDESSNDYLSSAEVKGALSNVVFSGGTIIDILFINSSYGSNIELYSDLGKFNRYLIASPKSINLQPLNYFEIIQTANNNINKSHEELARAIYGLKSVNRCEDNLNFTLFNTDKAVNISNAMESIASAQLQDPSNKFREEIIKAVSNSSKLYSSTDVLPAYNFTQFADNLSLAGDEEVRAAGERLVNEIESTVVQSCNEFINHVINVNFPDYADTRLDAHLKLVNYDRLASFKEFIRSTFTFRTTEKIEYNEDFSKEDGIISQNLSVKQLACTSGIKTNNGYLLLDENPGYIENDQFNCVSKISDQKLDDTVLPLKIRNNFYVKDVILNSGEDIFRAEIIFNDELEIYTISILGTALRDIFFEKQVTEDLEFLEYSLVLDNSSTFSYVTGTSFKLEDFKFDFDRFNQDLDFGTTYYESINSIITVISNSSSTNLGLSLNNKLFSIGNNLSEVEFTKIEFEQPELAESESVSFDLSNKDATESRTIKNFRYFEYIYAAPPSDEQLARNILYGDVNLGEDIRYYQSDLIADEENVNFWDEWFNSLESSKQIERN